MNEISVYQNMDMTSISKLGECIAKSGMFGCEKVEQGVILALQCITEGKPPLEMAKTYHIIGGKLSKRTDAMLADFRKIGGRVKWVKFDNVEARAVFSLDGNDTEVAYTMQDATNAGLIRKGSGWEKHPAAMLRARLISSALRMIAPEIVCGTYSPEELSDSEPLTQPKKSIITVKSEPVASEDTKAKTIAEARAIVAGLGLTEDWLQAHNVYIDDLSMAERIVNNLDGFKSAVERWKAEDAQ